MDLAILLMLWDLFQFLTIFSPILYLYTGDQSMSDSTIVRIWKHNFCQYQCLPPSWSTQPDNLQFSSSSSSSSTNEISRRIIWNKFYSHIFRSDDDLSILAAS